MLKPALRLLCFWSVFKFFFFLFTKIWQPKSFEKCSKNIKISHKSALMNQKLNKQKVLLQPPNQMNNLVDARRTLLSYSSLSTHIFCPCLCCCCRMEAQLPKTNLQCTIKSFGIQTHTPLMLTFWWPAGSIHWSVIHSMRCLSHVWDIQNV